MFDFSNTQANTFNTGMLFTTRRKIGPAMSMIVSDNGKIAVTVHNRKNYQTEFNRFLESAIEGLFEDQARLLFRGKETMQERYLIEAMVREQNGSKLQEKICRIGQNHLPLQEQRNISLSVLDFVVASERVVHLAENPGSVAWLKTSDCGELSFVDEHDPEFDLSDPVGEMQVAVSPAASTAAKPVHGDRGDQKLPWIVVDEIVTQKVPPKTVGAEILALGKRLKDNIAAWFKSDDAGPGFVVMSSLAFVIGILAVNL